MERKGAVTLKSKPVTLIGQVLEKGNKVPDFVVLDKDLKEVSLRDFAGKAKLISVAVSLDTPVCDTQARKFNEEAAQLPAEVAIMNITMDLPFAIGRFCSAAGIDRIKTLSDYRDASFGMAFGVLIKELRLLARAIFLVDRDNILRYSEIVPEVTGQVNFEKALAETRSLLAKT
jgi:thioredoxin-dependent peroxiredoxin